MILTYLQLPVAIPEMHAVAETIPPHFAFVAFVGFHPFAVAVQVKFGLPDIPKTVVVDVSLMTAQSQAA